MSLTTTEVAKRPPSLVIAEAPSERALTVATPSHNRAEAVAGIERSTWISAALQRAASRLGNMPDSLFPTLVVGGPAAGMLVSGTVLGVTIGGVLGVAAAMLPSAVARCSAWAGASHTGPCPGRGPG